MEFLLNIFSSSSVRSEIMAVLNERILKAEADFKVGSKSIADQLVIDLKIAKDNATSKTQDLLKVMVRDVVADLVK
jgi:hypothetical protein